MPASRAVLAGNALVLAMCLGFLLVVLLMAGWWLWTVYGLVGMETFFRPAEATILSAKVVRHPDSEDGDRWEVRLLYRYEVDGRTYEGYRYNPSFGGGFRTEAAAQEVVDALQPGTVVTIRYDPLMPSQSAVSSDLYSDGVELRPLPGGVALTGGGQVGTLVFVPCFFLLGAGIIWYHRRRARKPGKKPDDRPLLVRFREWTARPIATPAPGPKPPIWFLPLVSLVFCGGGLWIMATAFTPRERSQISMGTPGQLFFGAVFFLIGLGPLGFHLLFRSPGKR